MMPSPCHKRTVVATSGHQVNREARFPTFERKCLLFILPKLSSQFLTEQRQTDRFRELIIVILTESTSADVFTDTLP